MRSIPRPPQGLRSRLGTTLALSACILSAAAALSVGSAAAVASPTAMIDCYNPFGVNFLREKFLPKMDKNYSGPKKFVIHRSNKSRGIVNEAEVYDFFRKLGWEIVDTEKLTFAQEIKLFNDAEAVTGVFGSGL